MSCEATGAEIRKGDSKKQTEDYVHSTIREQMVECFARKGMVLVPEVKKLRDKAFGVGARRQTR